MVIISKILSDIDLEIKNEIIQLRREKNTIQKAKGLKERALENYHIKEKEIRIDHLIELKKYKKAMKRTRPKRDTETIQTKLTQK